MNWNKPCRTGLLFLMVLMTGCASTLDTGRDDTASGSAIPSEFLGRFQQAVALMEDDPDQARRALTTLHRERPELTGPLVNLCVLDFRAGETAAARTCFEKVLARDPEQPDALNHLGVLARQDGEFGQAEDYYRQALTADPEHRPSIRNLGILLDLYQGRHQEALDLYQQYQALLPEPDPMVAQWVADLKNRL
ncbi:tetratricopeptide repeat protein [Marinobacter sp. M1N3S26]|uniref:tetratricopeptide repeat protein n=1 Tax=Marinobacter sp. M1N3S26 TaxID=3382299 RepID=UPI00387B5065